MVSLMVSLAETWGRNTTAAQAMVVSDIAYSAADAHQYHLSEGNASTLQGALSQFGLGPGYTVVQEGVYDQLLSALSDPNLYGILILLGAIAIVLDLWHPTFVLSIAGAIALVAGLVGAEVVGASAPRRRGDPDGRGADVPGAEARARVRDDGRGRGRGSSASTCSSRVSSTRPPPDRLHPGGGGGGGSRRGFRRALHQVDRGPAEKQAEHDWSEVAGREARRSRVSLRREVRVEGMVWRARSALGRPQPGEHVKVKAVEGLVLVVERGGKARRPTRLASPTSSTRPAERLYGRRRSRVRMN